MKRVPCLGGMAIYSAAKATLFLALDDSAFIVGTEILSNGGMMNISLMN